MTASPADTGHVALHPTTDDPGLDAYIVVGLVRLEEFLATHAAFDQVPLRHYDSDALDRLIEAVRSHNGLA